MARRSGAGSRPRVRRGGWSDELEQAFLALLRSTGNARAAARLLGRPNSFHNRRRRDPVFAARWQAAVAEADARLAGADKAWPDGADARASAAPAPSSFGPCPSPARQGSGGEPAEDFGGWLRPGRKRPQSMPQPVIRRAANGRTQVTLARDGHWTQEIEEDFLARLRETGNVSACARAVGFEPASVFERMRRWSGFARDCDEAIEEAKVRLEYRLVGHASNLLGAGSEGTGAREEDGGLPLPPAPCGPGSSPGRAPAGPHPEGEREVRFDPVAAMRILAFLDARKAGRGRKAAAPRSFAEAVRSILAKLDAIERHRARQAAKAAAAAAEEEPEA